MGTGVSNEGRLSRIYKTISLIVQPGIGIKRWFATATFGLSIAALGLAFTVSAPVSESLASFGRTITLGWAVSGVARGSVFLAIGVGLTAISGFMLYRRAMFGAQYRHPTFGVLESLSADRVRRSGPRIVALGGGTGLASLLRGLKEHTENITAVVTTADDGGSSGRLREELGIPPPGDARQCLIALSDSEPLMEELLSYRFESGAALGGHSFGNLLLAALSHTQGSFHEALQGAASLLAVRGQVVPAALGSDIQLQARTGGGKILEGESSIGKAGEPIADLWIVPSDPHVNPAVIQAIDEADLIVIGPGSLYTSILPNFLVPGISGAVASSSVPKILVCNVATQHGETDGMSASDHLDVFRRHTSLEITHFLVNGRPLPIADHFHQTPLTTGTSIPGFSGGLVLRDLVSEIQTSRHDPQKLAKAVLSINRTRG